MQQTDSASDYGVIYLTHTIFLMVYQFSLSRLLFPYVVITFFVFIILFIIISFVVLSDIGGTMTMFFVLMLVGVMLGITCYSVESFIRNRWILTMVVEKEREKIELEKHLSGECVGTVWQNFIIIKTK